MSISTLTVFDITRSLHWVQIHENPCCHSLYDGLLVIVFQPSPSKSTSADAGQTLCICRSLLHHHFAYLVVYFRSKAGCCVYVVHDHAGDVVLDAFCGFIEEKYVQ